MTQLTEQRPSATQTGAASPPARGSSFQARAAMVAVLVLVVGGGFSVARRFSDHRTLVLETEKLAVPTVTVIKPATEPSNDNLVLPAQLQAYVESSIFSRTNGYLLRWYKDMGSHVKKGELLAEI